MDSLIKHWLLIMGVILLFSTVMWIRYFYKPNLLLVAQDSVPVYESLDRAKAAPPQIIIARLQPYQSVEIIKCIDVKHYQIYKVRLPDGRLGFVNEGKYILIRNSKPSSC